MPDKMGFVLIVSQTDVDEKTWEGLKEYLNKKKIKHVAIRITDSAPAEKVKAILDHREKLMEMPVKFD